MKRQERHDLNLRESRFVDAYLGSCAGNATAAARAAGYAGSLKVLGIQGVRLLGKASVRAAIQAREKRAQATEILTADQRDRHLSKLALSEAVPPATQVAAIKELNKCSGRHSIKHMMDVTEKLSDIIARSRAPG